MNVVVLYESMFGNTHQIAEAVADGVRQADPAAQVACVPVAEAQAGLIRAADLLVVGGPTHMRGMTSGMSRKMGRAAHGIARRLRRHGYELVGEPEGFIIEGTEGPLRAGEPERAKAWGADLERQSAR
jgi:multimeric flavodoxin WrbA